MKKYKIILPLLIVGFFSCNSDLKDPIDEDTYHSGHADFSTYVAVGNSLTAGHMDGAMFKSGQKYSFPNILAKQFKSAGGGNFTQPSFEDDVNDIGGLTLGGIPIPGNSNRMVVLMTKNGPSITTMSGISTIELSNLQKKAYNNMGVSGAKSFHLIKPGYGNLNELNNTDEYSMFSVNPYFVRHATSDNASIIEDAMSLNPTFFTNWIGANDVLTYALSGGIGVNQLGNPDPSTYSYNDITDPQVFKNSYKSIVNSLTSNGAKGVLATIPNITSVPYFTLLPYNPLSPELLGGEQIINNLNQLLFTNLKGILSACGDGNRLQLFSTTEANPVLIKDDNLVDRSAQIADALSNDPNMAPVASILGQIYGQVRHATPNDIVLLTSMSVIGTLSVNPILDNLPPQIKQMIAVKGISYPLGNEYVLIPEEQKVIQEATESFNKVITEIANAKKIALFDANSVMNKMSKVGVQSEDGQLYNSDYFTGAENINSVMFSLDGVHPNARGYAFIANEVVKVVNEYYKSNIPLVCIGTYPGPKIITKN